MSHVNAAIRWMHLSYSNIARKSLHAVPKTRVYYHARNSTFRREFSSGCSSKLDPNTASLIGTEMTQIQLDNKDFPPTPANGMGQVQHSSTLQPAVPLDFKMSDTNTQRNEDIEGLDANIMWRISKSYHNTWDTFRNRSLDLPLAGDYVSGPVPTEQFQKEFALDFSQLLFRYSGGASLPVLRKVYAEAVNDADMAWSTLNDKIVRNWLDYYLGARKRSRRLVHLFVGSLLKSADRMLDILDILQDLNNDFDVRASCLHLTGVFYKSDLLADQLLMARFDRAVDKLRSYEKWPEYGLHADIIRLLMWRSNHAQVLGLLSCLRLKYTHLPKETIVLLANCCIARDLHKESFALLMCLNDRALQKPSRAVMHVCVKLLQYDTIVETAQGPNFLYLSALLERGLPPNKWLYGKVIENALVTQFPGVAWDVYHHTKSLVITLPSSTYTQLLRHAFDQQRVSDVKDILAQIHQKEALHKDRELVLYSINMVRRLCHAQRSMSASEGLSHILALYDRIWKREPLIAFGIIPKESEHTEKLGELCADEYVISFTVWSYILCHKNGKSVRHLWARIAHLVGQRDSTVVRCMYSDLIYNAFIWLNMKHPENFHDAIEIFRHMLVNDLCLPTSRTWSIIICGFLHHKQDDKAQQLYEMMQSHGFTIDHIGKEYLPTGATMDDLRLRVDTVLSEQNVLQDSSSNEGKFTKWDASTESAQSKHDLI